MPRKFENWRLEFMEKVIGLEAWSLFILIFNIFAYGYFLYTYLMGIVEFSYHILIISFTISMISTIFFIFIYYIACIKGLKSSKKIIKKLSKKKESDFYRGIQTTVAQSHGAIIVLLVIIEYMTNSFNLSYLIILYFVISIINYIDLYLVYKNFS